MAVVSAQGVAQVRRYLLPSERPVITTRRHWVIVLEPALTTLIGIGVASWAADAIGDSFPLLVNVLVLASVALVARFAWMLVQYRRDWFVVTDERLLLTYGVVTRRVAIMPLTKVTDMSYNVTLLGRLLGYGEFVFESAGQEQALRTVNYLGRSNELFAVLSNELFGEHGIASSRRRRRPRSTED